MKSAFIANILFFFLKKKNFSLETIVVFENDHVRKMLAIHSRDWISLCIIHISINYDTALHCSFKPNTWLREQDTPTVQTIKFHSTCCFICEQLVHNIMELFYIVITFYCLLGNSWFMIPKPNIVEHFMYSYLCILIMTFLLAIVWSNFSYNAFIC